MISAKDPIPQTWRISELLKRSETGVADLTRLPMLKLEKPTSMAKIPPGLRTRSISNTRRGGIGTLWKVLDKMKSNEFVLKSSSCSLSIWFWKRDEIRVLCRLTALVIPNSRSVNKSESEPWPMDNVRASTLIIFLFISSSITVRVKFFVFEYVITLTSNEHLSKLTKIGSFVRISYAIRVNETITIANTKQKHARINRLANAMRVSCHFKALKSIARFAIRTPVAVLKVLEAIRARFFWEAEDGERRIQWVAWNKVMQSKTKGGLGIGSLSAFNKALLFKWKWRYRNNPQSLWVRVLDVIHGSTGGRRRGTGGVSPWVTIGRVAEQLKDNEVDMEEFVNIKVGNGVRTRFWLDKWLGNQSLRDLFPRVFMLEVDPEVRVVDRSSEEKVLAGLLREPRARVVTEQLGVLLSKVSNYNFSEANDTWIWELEASANDRIPTRLNLRDKGIELHSVLCPVCEEVGESAAHLFLACMDSVVLWRKIALWWGVNPPDLASINSMLCWSEMEQMDVETRRSFDAVVLTTFWVIWTFRNNLLFGKSKLRLRRVM
ncbi:hypothetical protein LXL04_033071 [Taraxacum kok-saghyz]